MKPAVSLFHFEMHLVVGGAPRQTTLSLGMSELRGLVLNKWWHEAKHQESSTNL